MPHPASQAEILEALESNARKIAAFFSGIPDAQFFEGDPEHWGPAHHLIHLSCTSAAIERGLGSGALPPHPAGRSRTYAEVRDAATSSLTATPRDRLLELGRAVTIEPGASRAGIVSAYEKASAGLRTAAMAWSEEALDRHAIPHPLIGLLSVREMLFFTVVHERHHLRLVQTRIEARSAENLRPS